MTDYLADRAESALVAELVYASYRANRELAPHIAIERWRMVYQNLDALEERYQHERADRDRALEERIHNG